MGKVISSIFGSKKPKAPPPPPAPTVDKAEVQAAAAEERKRRAAAEGRASTILTQLSEDSGASIARKKLLGQ